jgi:hypothetical protein
MVGNEEFNCKPDFMIGNRIIDAKFPCDTDKLAPKMPTGTGRKNVQDFSRGPAMKTTKELLAYPEMTVDGTPGGEKIGDNVSVMGPKEAAKKKGANCRCS